MNKIVNYIDLKSLFISNLNVLNISLEELAVLLAIVDVKKNNETPFPEEVAQHMGVDKEMIVKPFESLLRSKLIKLESTELSLSAAINMCTANENIITVYDMCEKIINQQLSQIEKMKIDSMISDHGVHNLIQIITEIKGGDFDHLSKYIEDHINKISKIEKANNVNWLDN